MQLTYDVILEMWITGGYIVLEQTEVTALIKQTLS